MLKGLFKRKTKHKTIHWSLSSKSEPLWNVSGTCQVFHLSDGYEEMNLIVDALMVDYGEPPDDLLVSWAKE